MVSNAQRRAAGFTLIELLVVMVIIGILATIGIPTFQRMVEHARQAEAKTDLGAIYTAEVGFFSEYNGFGNNILAMGISIGGSTTVNMANPNNLIYCAGFPGSNGCTNAAVYPNLGNASDPTAALIASNYPAYYNMVGTVVGRTLMSGSVYNGAGPSGAPIGVSSSGQGLDDIFVASATGVIAPGFNRNGTSPSTPVDVWTIDQAQNLVHYIDGTR